IEDQYILWHCYHYKKLNQGKEAAIKLYRLAAEQGNVEAQNRLGDFYYKDNPMSSFYNESGKWYSLAAYRGNADAQYNLSHYYYIEENDEESIKWLKLAAKNGNTFAQYVLGEYYFYGLMGCEEKLEEGIKWYKLASENGNLNAQSILGHFYLTGFRGCEKNKEEGIKLLRLAAKNGHEDVQYQLGHYYFYGKVVEQSYEEAFKWFLKASENSMIAKEELAKCYFYGLGTDKNLELAVTLYKECSFYSSTAQCALGYCYYKGLGVKKNKEEAIKCFRKAFDDANPFAKYNLEQCKHNLEVKSVEEIIEFSKKMAPEGNPVAQNILGYCYQQELGGFGHDLEEFEHDRDEALKWYRLAAEQGNADAQYNLSEYYRCGQEENKEEFYKWLKLAAFNGNPIAQIRFGYYYLYNQKDEPSWLDMYGDSRYAYDLVNDDNDNEYCIIDNDNECAVKWIKTAAAQGSPKAQFAVGNCYFYGYGVKKNKNVALDWWKHAALQGSFLAQKSLYDWYQDTKEGIKWLKMAANQGDVESQVELAYIYYNGIGIERNYIEAAKWYKEAALKEGEYSQYGIEYPQFMLGYCYYKGEGVEQSYEKSIKWYKKAETAIAKKLRLCE
ncbi:MAG: SEL1-like repeat protein, partial [Anaeroplasmataceae bacterium]|nr:SEL1-like repeat protein [Anaeroplasmataceae bacterium]